MKISVAFKNDLNILFMHRKKNKKVKSNRLLKYISQENTFSFFLLLNFMLFAFSLFVCEIY